MELRTIIRPTKIIFLSTIELNSASETVANRTTDIVINIILFCFATFEQITFIIQHKTQEFEVFKIILYQLKK